MPILKQGSSGPDVKDLQQKLKALGFDPNGTDGNFGPGTKAAVIAFQQSKGLQADGTAGPATIAALQAAYGSGTDNSAAATTDAGATGANSGGEGTDGEASDGLPVQTPASAAPATASAVADAA